MSGTPRFGPRSAGWAGRLRDPFGTLYSQDTLDELRALHPSSDVVALVSQELDVLRMTLALARDLYNGGRMLGPIPHNGAPLNRIDMVREVLMLRARFGKMGLLERNAMPLGCSSAMLRKGIDD